MSDQFDLALSLYLRTLGLVCYLQHRKILPCQYALQSESLSSSFLSDSFGKFNSLSNNGKGPSEDQN